MFEERLKQKKAGNPIQNVYKLIMNSSYGKTLLKPFEDETKYIYGGENDELVNKHIVRNYNYIKDFEKLTDGKTWKINQYATIEEHYNNAICGVEVLSMSKRIMNQVISTAEDNNLDIYYQDTDSLHIKEDQVKILESIYRNKYGRELNGKGMGQFHIDFESNIIKENIVAVKSIFLGKKCYIDLLQGLDEKGNTVYDYHIRMKGVASQAVLHEAEINYDYDVLEIYKKLYNEEPIIFDMGCGGKKINFEFNKNMTVSTNLDFKRKVQFTDYDNYKKEVSGRDMNKLFNE